MIYIIFSECLSHLQSEWQLVDWGDGSSPVPTEYVTGTTEFLAAHGYEDDGEYVVSITLLDDDGGVARDEIGPVTINNVAPSIDALKSDIDIVSEGGIAPISGSFSDPGSKDDFRMMIDWGDGSDRVLRQLAGPGEFSAMHRYIDDDDDDKYIVTIAVADGDGGMATKKVAVKVVNTPPVIRGLRVKEIDENGRTTLLGVLGDRGIQDTFQVRVQWEESTPAEIFEFGPDDVKSKDVRWFASKRRFMIRHRYLDDPQNALAYPISVSVMDDDGGKASGSIAVKVNNVAPYDLNLVASEIDEQGYTSLTGKFIDPGTLDTFTVRINWGDSTGTQVFNFGTVDVVEPGIRWTASQRQFVVRHRYPVHSLADSYTISVGVQDDDAPLATTGTVTLMSSP